MDIRAARYELPNVAGSMVIGVLFVIGFVVGVYTERGDQAARDAVVRAEMEEFDRARPSTCTHEGEYTICRWRTEG